MEEPADPKPIPAKGGNWDGLFGPSCKEMDEKIKGLLNVLARLEEGASNTAKVDTTVFVESEPGKIDTIEVKSFDGRNFQAVSSMISWNFTVSRLDGLLEISLPGYFYNKQFPLSKVLTNSCPGTKSFQKAQNTFKKRLTKAGIDDDKFAFLFTAVLLTLLREGWLEK